MKSFEAGIATMRPEAKPSSGGLFHVHATHRFDTAAKLRAQGPATKIPVSSQHDSIMKRLAALCLAAWSAAALLYFGRHSTAFIVLSGVLALAGFDLLRPESNERS